MGEENYYFASAPYSKQQLDPSSVPIIVYGLTFAREPSL